MEKLDMIICPFCGCEIWSIGNDWFQCFLCKVIFFGKPNLSGKAQTVNKNLQALKKIGMYKFPKEEGR